MSDSESSVGARLEFPRRAPPGREYWLCNCQGYRVDSADGRLGIVEEVRFGSRHDCPDVLAVRAGLFATRLVLVPVAEVEDVVPRDERVLLRASPTLDGALSGGLGRTLRRRSSGSTLLRTPGP